MTVLFTFFPQLLERNWDRFNKWRKKEREGEGERMRRKENEQIKEIVPNYL